MSKIMAPPIAHEKIAAGPAITEALSAPKSQPDPMIDPTLANNRPIRPMSRRMFVLSAPEGCFCASTVVMGRPSNWILSGASYP
jgi:hypothetical protein